MTPWLTNAPDPRAEALAPHAGMEIQELNQQNAQLRAQLAQAGEVASLEASTKIKPVLLAKDHEAKLKDHRIAELEAAVANGAHHQADAAQAWSALRESQQAREKEQARAKKRAKEDAAQLNEVSNELAKVLEQLAACKGEEGLELKAATRWRTLELELEEKTALITQLRGQKEEVQKADEARAVEIVSLHEDVANCQGTIHSLQAPPQPEPEPEP